MLISKRRIQAAAVLLLVILTAALVRPVRTWIDQALVASVASEKLQIEELELHANSSVVELRGLRWQHLANGRKYGLHAKKTWLAFDGLKLVDRQFHIGRIELEEADLYVKDFSQKFVRAPSTWQQQLAMQVVQLRWDEVKDHFSSLLAADGIHTTWAERIQQWVQQSESLVQQLSSIQAGEELNDNPLRVEDQLKQRIRTVEELQIQQAKLAGQFDTLQKLLEAECKRLRDTFESEIGSLEHAQTHADEERDSGSIAIEISVDLAESSWTLFSVMAEVGDMLARDLAITKQTPDYDRNITDNLPATENPHIEQIYASGSFRCGDSVSPYAFHRDIATTGDWEFVFELPQAQVATRVKRNDELSDEVQIDLVSVRKTNGALSPSDRGIDLAVFDELIGCEAHRTIAKLHLVSTPTGIRGEMQVPLPNGDQMSPAWTTLRKNAEELVGEQEAVLQIDIAGSWRAPEISLRGNTTPDWLVQSIQNEFDYGRRQSSTGVAADARQKLEAQIERIQSLVMTASSRGKQEIESHSQTLANAASSLQAALDDLNGTSFARRPGAAATR